MLPSLRPLIAESMRAMAFSPHGLFHVPEASYDETVRLLDGANTLEWCDQRDLDNETIENLLAERDRLLDEIEELGSRLDDVLAGIDPLGD